MDVDIAVLHHADEELATVHISDALVRVYVLRQVRDRAARLACDLDVGRRAERDQRLQRAAVRDLHLVLRAERQIAQRGGHLALHLAELCLAVAVQTHVDYDAPGCEKLLLRLLLLAYLGLLVAMLTALPALSSTVRFSRWVKALCCFVRLDETAEQVIVHCLTTVRR